MIKKILLIIFVVIFFASLGFNAYLGVQLAWFVQDFKEQQGIAKVLSFRDMFTENVLLSDKEVDFDTRLAMETAVRNLNDPAILSQWQRFVKCENQQEASKEAKELLRLLIEKTRF